MSNELISEHEMMVRWVEKIRTEAIEEVRENWRADVAERDKRIAALEAERDARVPFEEYEEDVHRAYNCGYAWAGGTLGSGSAPFWRCSSIERTVRERRNALAQRKEVSDG